MEELTENQKGVLLFIDEYSKENGYPPSHKDIAKFKGNLENAAYEVVLALVKKGYVTKKSRLSRSIVLTKKGKLVVGLHNCLQ